MTNVPGKNILVTGINGYVGFAIAKSLLQAGYHVRGIVLPHEISKKLNPYDLEIFVGDILDEAFVAECVDSVEYVFHTASLYTATPFYASQNPLLKRVNLEGTDNLLKCALKAGVKKFIYTGSTGSIGVREDGLPSDELVPFNHLSKRSQYEISKMEAENLVLSYHEKGLNVSSINPSFLVGEGDSRPSPTGEVVLKFLNQTYPCYFDGTICLSDLTSVVKAHISALTKAKSGEKYIVAVDEIISIKDFFELLQKISGIRPPCFKLPKGLLMFVAQVNELLLLMLGLRNKVRPLISYELLRYFTLGVSYSADKAKRELDFIPTKLEDECRKAVRWFMLHGKVKKSSRIKYYRHIGKL